MDSKKRKISLQDRAGQSVIEYILLVAISVVALIAGSNFVANAKKGGFEGLFQAAKYRINNPGNAIVGSAFSSAKNRSADTDTGTGSTSKVNPSGTPSTPSSGKGTPGIISITPLTPTCFGGSCGKDTSKPIKPSIPCNKKGGLC